MKRIAIALVIITALSDLMLWMSPPKPIDQPVTIQESAAPVGYSKKDLKRPSKNYFQVLAERCPP